MKTDFGVLSASPGATAGRVVQTPELTPSLEAQRLRSSASSPAATSTRRASSPARSSAATTRRAGHMSRSARPATRPTGAALLRARRSISARRSPSPTTIRPVARFRPRQSRRQLRLLVGPPDGLHHGDRRRHQRLYALRRRQQPRRGAGAHRPRHSRSAKSGSRRSAPIAPAWRSGPTPPSRPPTTRSSPSTASASSPMKSMPIRPIRASASSSPTTFRSRDPTSPTSSWSSRARAWRSSRRTRQICIDGVKHGGRYQIRVRGGLPAPTARCCRIPPRSTSMCRDRAPWVGFAGNAYVLPAGPGASIPLVSVNADKAQVNIYRIGDRGIAATIRDGQFLRALDGYTAEQDRRRERREGLGRRDRRSPRR